MNDIRSISRFRTISGWNFEHCCCLCRKSESPSLSERRRRRRLWICRFAWTTQTRCPHTHSRRKSSSRKLLDLKDKGRRDHTLTSAIPGPRSGVHFSILACEPPVGTSAPNCTAQNKTPRDGVSVAAEQSPPLPRPTSSPPSRWQAGTACAVPALSWSHQEFWPRALGARGVYVILRYRQVAFSTTSGMVRT